MPQNHCRTLRQCWWRQLLPRMQPVNQLRENPWIPLRTAPDHHRIRPRDLEGTFEIDRTADIPAHNDGNPDRTLHCGNRCIVRVAAVELLARSSVHGDGIHADCLRHACDFHCVARGIVPTEPHLHRERQTRRTANRRQNLLRPLRVTHQG